MKDTHRYLLLLRFLCCLLLVLGAGCTKQARTQRHLTRANKYFDAKDLKKAEIEYLNVLRLDPTNAWVMTRLATIHYDHGDILRALPFLLGAVNVHDDNPGIRVKLGRIYLSAGQFQKTREEAIYLLNQAQHHDDAIMLLADSSATSNDIADSFQRLEKMRPEAANRASWHLASATLYFRQTNTVAAENALQKALSIEPESSAVHAALGNVFWQKKDFEKADQAYQKSSALAPADLPLQIRRVELKFSTGATNEAKEILRRLTQQAPDYTPAWVYTARIHFLEQNFQECSNIVERILARDGANYEARLLRAGLKTVQGKPDRAIKDLEETQQLYPRSAEVALRLAQVHVRNQDRQKAITFAQQAVALDPNSTEAILLLAELNLAKGDAASAVTSLERLLARQPNASRAGFLLASAYTAQRRFDDALPLYNALERSFPTNPSIPFLTGLALRQNNHNADARKAFQTAHKLAPEDLLPLEQLMELDLLEKNYQGAFQRVREVLQKNPRSAGAKFLEARIFLAQTNLTEAEAALKTTIEWEPNFAPAYGLLAQLYLASNKQPQAIQNLEESLTRNPKNLSALMLLGNLYEQTAQAEKAVAKYKDVLKFAPQSVPALNNLAYLLCEKFNKLDEAYDHAAKARQLAADELQATSVADTLGWILYRRGEYDRAFILLQESAAKSPTQPTIQFHLGMAAYASAQELPARAAFKRALDLSPTFPGRNEALDRLAVLEIDMSRPDQGLVDKLQDRVRKQPADIVAFLRLGRSYEKLGLMEKAIQATENAKKLNPASVPVLAQLAQLYSKKDAKRALDLAREARKLAPNDPSVASILGRLAYDAGDHARASSLLQESADKQPGDPELLLDLAHALYSLGRIDEAEQNATRAMGLGGAFARQKETQWLLTLIRLHKSPAQAVNAEAQVQQSLKTSPDYLPALTVAGLIYEQQGRAAEARQLYGRILSKYPMFIPATRQLVILSAASGENDKQAHDAALRARQAYPGDPEVARACGILAYRKGDFTRTVQLLSEGAAKYPADPDVFYYLGMAQCRLKQQKEGEIALRRALDLKLRSPQADEARRMLASVQAKK